MNDKNQFKLNWQKALSSLVIGFGTVAYLDSAAIATPVEHNLQLAQVGVRSRITPPTPLNLRPRSHTPLPRSNYSRYRRHRHLRRDNSYRNYRHYDGHHNHHRNTSHKRRRNRGRVIIINPDRRSNYGNYGNSGSYIRVIRN